MTPANPIDWNGLGRERFDRTVEALILTAYDEQWSITVTNGRGGDGGIDIRGERSGVLWIWQLKYFPGGFSSTHRQRRQQIKRSFESAMKHKPHKWTLVVPQNPTNHEIEFVRELRRNTDHQVEIDIWGQARLDSLISKYPTIHRHLADSDHVAQLLRETLEERSTPKTLSDLASRAYLLDEQANSMSPNWNIDVSLRNKKALFTVRPAHSLAQEREPISIKITGTFAQSESEKRALWDEMIGYGAPGTVQLDASNIESLQMSPSFLDSKDRASQLIEITSDPQPPEDTQPLTLVFQNADGAQIAAYTLPIVHGAQGYAGSSLILKSPFGQRISILLPNHSTGTDPKIKVIGTPQDGTPEIHAGAAQLLEHFHAAEQIILRSNHGVLFQVRRDYQINEREVRQLRDLRATATDLHRIQEAVGSIFPMPDELEAIERLHLRVIRLMLEGNLVRHPVRTAVELQVDSAVAENLGSSLFDSSPQAITFEASSSVFNLHGHELSLPPITFYSPSAVFKLIDVKQKALIRNGKAKATLSTTDGLPMFCFMPSRVPGETPDSNVSYAPWGLEGFNEPPATSLDPGAGTQDDTKD